MFCKNCGAENKDGAKFCRSCGQVMGEARENTLRKQSLNLKGLLPIIIGGCAAVVALIVIILVVVNAKPTIKLDDYLTIEISGYDGYGAATVIIDWDGIEEKYGEKLKLTSQAEQKFGWLDLDPIGILRLCIGVSLEDTDGLSNGDIIAYTWNVDEELYTYVKCNTKYKDDSYTVEGLEETETFDAFADLEVTFSGISPNGRLEYDYTGSQLSKYDFKYDKSSELKNGDTVIFSISDRGADYYIKNYGMIPTGFEKEYVVNGLDEYVESYDTLSDAFIANLKSEAEDAIYAYTAGYYNETTSMTNLTYAGYIFTSLKDGRNSNVYNSLYIIYSGTVSSSEGSFSTSKVYYPVRFTDIVSGENGFAYSNNGGIVGSSGFDGSWNSTKGYINPLTCYMDLVEAVRDNFTAECGDGFEAYAEYDLITTMDDISDEYKAFLYADAKDKIESYYATGPIVYGSEVSNVEFLGEYLLLAKTQGTDFASNNRYYIVFTATVSNSENFFDTTDVYIPVEYDGIVKLPGNEYMTMVTKGLGDNNPILNGYSIRGYEDGSEMYTHIVTANRDNYTYEVSENLKQFGD